MWIKQKSHSFRRRLMILKTKSKDTKITKVKELCKGLKNLQKK